MYTQPALRDRIPIFAGSPEQGVPAYVPNLPVSAHPVIQSRSNDPTAVPKRINVWTQFFEGMFGLGNPNTDVARDVSASMGASAPNVQPRNSFYVYHIGDLFTPGTQNFVFEPTTELTPLTTIWGNAFLRKPNTFSVRQPPQSWADYNKFINGIGGLQAGQYAHQSLESIGQ